MIPIIPNVFTGPSHEPSPSPIARVTPLNSQIAFHGVFQRGCTFPRIGGSARTRPMSKRTRVVAFWIAMQTASPELTAAMRMMIQAPPQSRRPSSKIWSALVKFLTLSVPSPTRTPQLTNM